MSVPVVGGPVDLSVIPGYVAAVGALGVAAFGMVEAVGKTLFVFDMPGGRKAGLPYVGFGKVRALLKLVGPALEMTYGEDYVELVRQQYRVGRSTGAAPDTIRQGVRLGLSFLAPAEAVQVIRSVWGMPEAEALRLAQALSAPPTAPNPTDQQATPTSPATTPNAQALAARFATALDSRVQSAFEIAEEVYKNRAQLWAAIVAVGLSLAYQNTTVGSSSSTGQWAVAFLVGLVAVPLAPVAKDLSSSLSDALTALGKLRASAK